MTLMRNVLLLTALFIGSFLQAQTRAEGLSAMQLENWDEAIRVYNALVTANPADQDLLLSLGNAYWAKGDKAKAQESFQKAVTLKSDSPLGLIAQARILLSQNNVAEVDKLLEKAKKSGKKDINVHRQAGESFLFYIPQGGNRPNYARAIDLLKSAVDVNSKDFSTLMALAYAYKEKPDGGLAAQQYDLAANLEPKNPLPQMMLAKVYKLAKIPARFEEHADKAIALDPTYTPALRAKAEFYYFGRQWEKALEAYRNLVNNGTNITIEDEMQLANSLFINKDYPGAIQLVERIVAKDGSKNYLRRLLAYSYYETGDFKNGINIMNDYFKIVPADKVIPRDYEYLGRLQLKTGGDTVVAIQNISKAIQMDSSTWPLYEEIGKLQYQQKNYCGAARSYEMYLDSVETPKATDWYYLGLFNFYCTEDTMHYEKAEKAFTKVTELNAKAPIGWLWRGKSAAKLDPDVALFEAQPELANQFGKAFDSFNKYVELASGDPVKNKKDLTLAYEYLTYVYYLRNDGTNFTTTADKLLAIDPENVTAKGLKDLFNANGGKGGVSTQKNKK